MRDKYLKPMVPKKDFCTMQELLDFCFPSSLQHPRSTGRLFTYALYGPFDMNGDLRCGLKGEHALQSFELDAMCDQFEREDIVQIYTPFGAPVSNMTEGQIQEVLSQANGDLKNAKGKASMKQITQEELIFLLKDIPKKAQEEGGKKNLMSFHDIQQCILKYRVDRIAEKKVMFPNVTATGSIRSKVGRRSDNKGDKKNLTMYEKRKQEILNKKAGLLKRPPVSEEVAPATMFQYDEGFTNADISRNVTKLLTTKAYKITPVEDPNNVSITQNVRLIREDGKRMSSISRPPWNELATMSRCQIGGHVKSAKSSTTVIRKNTIH